MIWISFGAMACLEWDWISGFQTFPDIIPRKTPRLLYYIVLQLLERTFVDYSIVIPVHLFRKE